MQMFLAQSWAWIHVASRVLLALYFVWAGINRFTHMADHVAQATASRAPLPKLGVPGAGILLLAGGLAVLLGWHRYIGAGLLAFVMLTGAFERHPFWRESEPAARANALSHFLKDLALAGAALFIAANAGANWPMSLGG